MPQTTGPGRRPERLRAGAADRALERELRRLLAALRRRYDHRGWWPARSRFEMMAGAILTQRARWDSAAAAVARLRRNRLLRHDRLMAAGPERVAALVRGCGDHRTKARRLRALCLLLERNGGPAGLAAMPTTGLRQLLLSVEGIGPETADVILLYAFRRPAFVADAYALRFLERMGLLRRARLRARYDAVHCFVTQFFGARALADLHAVIVEHGKALCGPRPRCGDCFLARNCDCGRGLTPGSRRAAR